MSCSSPTKLTAWRIMKLPTDASLAELQHALQQQLPPNLDDTNASALVLLSHVLQTPKTWVLAHPEARLNSEQHQRFVKLVQRFAEGEPLPYLTGRQEFFGLEFKVSPAVLIPRPETELLVEEALAWLRAQPDPLSALDLGTGSGCIAAALASRLPSLRVTALDISADALSLAAENARALRVSERVTFMQADLIPSALPRFNLICANLPYIPTHQLSAVNSLPYEPAQALDGGTDGLRLLRRFFNQAPRHLSPGGLLLAETEADLGAETRSLALEAFPDAQVDLLKDLNQRDRLVRVQLA